MSSSMYANLHNGADNVSPLSSPMNSRPSSPLPMYSSRVEKSVVDPFTKLLQTTSNTPPDTVVVNHRKNKSATLIGFDPLLSDSNSKVPKPGSVWNGGGVGGTHPFDRSSQPSSPKTATTIASSALFSASKTHRPTLSAASGVSSLSMKDSRDDEDHMVTLGKSMRDSQERRGLLKRLSSVRKHSRTQSLGGLVNKARTRTRSTPGTPNISPNTGRRISDLSMESLALPSLLAKPSPTSFLDGHVENALRSSEQDPAPHQVELPRSPADCLGFTKLCALLEKYKRHDQNFDFGALRGMSSMQLQQFCNSGKCMNPKLVPAHKPILKELIEATSSHTWTVGGYVAHSTAEALILDVQHQILVVLRGKGGLQQKPVSAKKARHVASKQNLAPPHQRVTVFPPFREAYFGLEGALGAILDRLVDANPFAEVVFCGHSFGAALATLASLRFAAVRPASRVSCFTTSTPRVGAPDFRSMVHTLPNLKVMRFEHGNDANTIMPADTGTHTWVAVGHTIQLKTMKAYRFDNHKPAGKVVRYTEKELSAYIKDLEKAKRDMKWIEDYSGNVGSGVLGNNNEKRQMA